MSFDKYHLLRDEEYQRLRQKQVQSYNPELRILTRLDDDMKEILNDNSVPVDAKLRIFNEIQQRIKDIKSSNQLNPSIAAAKVAADTQTEVLVEPQLQEMGVGEDAVAARQFQDVGVGPDAPRYHDIGVGGDEVVEKAPAAAAAAAPIEPKNTAFDKIVLKYVPDNTKTKATQFLSFIQDRPDVICKNEKNEIVIKGKVIRGSNYIDLYKSMFSSHVSGSSPEGAVGHSQFLNALLDINIPESSISNSKQREKLIQLKKSKSPSREEFQNASDNLPGTPVTTAKQKGEGLNRPPGKHPRILKLYHI